MLRIDLRSGERREARDVEEVLHRKGHARQRTRLPARGDRGVHGVGIAQRALGQDSREAVDPGIAGAYPLESRPLP